MRVVNQATRADVKTDFSAHASLIQATRTTDFNDSVYVTERDRPRAAAAPTPSTVLATGMRSYGSGTLRSAHVELISAVALAYTLVRNGRPRS